MILIIAEKEVLANAIAAALPGKENSRKDGSLGMIVKGQYSIVWTNGHLLTLKDPEDYDEKYKKWNLNDLPIYFDNWGNKVARDPFQKKGQTSRKEMRVKQIGKLLKEADSVIHAGDTDEEGQLLVDELLSWFHYKGKVMRLDTADTSKITLEKKLKSMEDNSKCINNGLSAYARSLGDIILGYNMSRYYTCINHSKGALSVGRVQTPTLGMVVKRDALIDGHKKVFYYNLLVAMNINGNQVTTKYMPNENNAALTDGKFLTTSYLKELESNLPGSFNDIIVAKKQVEEAPPLPFNLTKLNVYCGKKWGYKPDEVMNITQSLRDDFNAITYNRSDCQYLSTEQFHEAPETVKSACANLNFDESLFDTNIKSKCFNDDNITAHFAIIPTSESVDLSKFNEKQKNVYHAIATYYLCQFMPNAVKEKTSLSIALEDGGFLFANSTVVVSPGYLSLIHDTQKKLEKEKNDLSKLEKGTYSGQVLGTKIDEKETKPPARYTQATLFEDMTRISKYVEDPEIKKLLLAKDKGKKGECGSIGTSATRDSIIKGLITKGFLEETKQKKKDIIISTEKGRSFYNMLPDEIKTAEVTAKWWVMQEDVKNNKASASTLAESVLKTCSDIIHSGNGAVKELAGNDFKVVGKCPQCGKDLVERKGKYGKFVSCSGYPECKYIQKKEQKLRKVVGKCPQCGKDLVERKGKYGVFVSCSGYPNCKFIKK